MFTKFFRWGKANAGLSSPDFGRSISPISTRRGDYAHHITTGTPGFPNLPTVLNSCLVVSWLNNKVKLYIQAIVHHVLCQLNIIIIIMLLLSGGFFMLSHYEPKSPIWSDDLNFDNFRFSIFFLAYIHLGISYFHRLYLKSLIFSNKCIIHLPKVGLNCSLFTFVIWVDFT